MALGAGRGCGGGLRSGAGAAASLYARGRGSELSWCGCFGAEGALGACSVRAVSVREGGRWARRRGSAEERGCARLPTIGLCGDPFVPPPLPGTNQPDPCRLFRLARRCCAVNFMGRVRLAGGVQRVSGRGRVKLTVNLADFSLPLRESAPRWETSLSVSEQKAVVSI